MFYPAGEAHGLLCSPTRGGKFRDYICQLLLTFEGSCFVIDPKGQATAVTARHREKILKQDVCVLNPFNILPDHLGKIRHASFDPITSLLDPESDTFESDADNLAEGWMPHGGPEVHWVDTARQLASGVAMYQRAHCKLWSLPDIYNTIASRELYGVCECALADDISEHIASRLSRFCGREAAENKEIRSVVSTAITKLGWVSNKPIARNLRTCTVDFREMRKRPMTVYVVTPARRLLPLAPWMRTITNSWADACLREGRDDIPVVGVLDEFRATMGNSSLSSISTLNAMGAGYGVQLISVIQGLGQLQKLMPDEWESYIANCGFQIFFRPRNDWTTSSYLSKMAGTEETHSASKSFGGNRTNVSLGSQGKPYLRPEEIRELPNDECLIWADGVPGVIRGGRRPYFKSPEFVGKFDEDPYHAKRP